MTPATYILPTIYFHRVVKDDPHYTNCPPLAFTAFAEAAADLCRTLTCAAALQMLGEGRDPPADALIITFDDGYKDLLEHAVPTLLALGLTAVIFPIVDFVGRKSSWSPRLADRAEHLSAADLRELAGLGFEIGSHTLTHPVLPTLGSEAKRREIQTSRPALEDVVGAPVRTFAYPYGAMDEEAVALAGETYEAAFSTGKSQKVDWRSERHALRRFYVERAFAPAALRQGLSDYREMRCDRT